MRKIDGAPIYSASDLVNFLGCTHATFLDAKQLQNPVELTPINDPYLALLQEKGNEHERAYLQSLRDQGLSVLEIDKTLPLAVQTEQTRKAMQDGVQVIYQGAFALPPWHGYSDFLIRVDDSPSALGSYSYEVIDTKLSLSAKPKHIIQLCVYSALIAEVQGKEPEQIHVVLGNKTKVSLRTSDFSHYYQIARQRFEAFVKTPPANSNGEPCKHCGMCRWSAECESNWLAADHLSYVANITGSQINKLQAAGITTLQQLADLKLGASIPDLQPDALRRLSNQARLQAEKSKTGESKLDVLPLVHGKGFARLPVPNEGDLFFDMEGDPLYEGGLEYLFGFISKDAAGMPQFTSFWAHSREEEKIAFENTIDFIIERLKKYPDAYIYHYAPYEETALKRLAMVHGTREVEVDMLLRQRKLVDLYKVVREAIQTSEPGYSIKNLEAFYTDKRAGDVKTAGDSIIVYEHWRQIGDAKLLQDISDYNEIDCRSTLMCRDWLLSLRPDSIPGWFSTETAVETDPAKSAARQEAEVRTAQLIERLIRGVSPAGKPWRELTGHLLEFHRREAKPVWWSTFARQEMSDEELIDDAESIGGLTRDPNRPPFQEKRSMVHTFRFPPQDFKMRVGGSPLRNGTLEAAGDIFALDEDELIISLKVGSSRSPFPDRFSIIPGKPLDDIILRDAIYRYADAAADNNESKYAAITSILRKDWPNLANMPPGSPIIPDETKLLSGAVDALCRLNNSHMLIQGPPGTGKTYTSSYAIVELLSQGKRIGISSNSHKAIGNLLAAIEKVAKERNITFRGIKKSKNEEQYFTGEGFIQNTIKNEDAESGAHQLIAGTAWLFAREKFDQKLDYLFIDEAGQVSLANVIAMGVSAKNIVLVGDQMQLAQPIQGTHPGSSGLSALQYLLGDHATVPKDRGIFLGITRRLCPDICSFISDAFYDGRLKPEAANANQQLLLPPEGALLGMPSTGLHFVPAAHDGNSQKSEEEAALILAAYQNLLGQRWKDKDNTEHLITINDILVVSPYNMQVNLLKQRLPEGARVGTVDKFQGQEAPVVLISMATSSGEELPRSLEFLYSSNRLNVAISRAKCLAVIFASPRLLEVPCNTIEQMRLVNTLCWARNYSAIALATKIPDIATAA